MDFTGNRIDHECVSVDSLVHYLQQKCGIQAIRYEKVPRGDDPPDFWLSIDGKKFAAEETSIVEKAPFRNIRTARKKGSTHGIPGPLKWEGEVRDDLTALMQHAVSSKRSKFEQKGVPDRCRGTILLLYDAHGCGDAQDAGSALLKVHGYDWFHSVFWAESFTDRPNDLYPDEPGRIGSMLYTKEDRWKGPLSS